MTVGYTTSKDTLSRNAGLSQQGPEYGTNSTVSNYWTRPSDWLQLPTVTSTDEKIAGLVGISNTDGQFLALNCSVTSGTYTVDWGDGLVETIASGTQANHQYDYASISSTLTSNGWKQVIVQVYPTTSGQKFTVINFNVKYANASVILGTLNSYCNPWLDLIVSSTNCTSFAFGNGTTLSYLTRLQQLQLLSTGTTMGSGNFGGLTELQSIPEFNLSNCTSGTNMQNWFYGCTKLKIAPKIDWSKCTNAFQMFSNCYGLVYVPDATTPMHASWSSPSSVTRLMFQSCASLVRAPWLDTSKNISTQNMFNGCSSLQYVPDYDYTICTDISGMFTGCFSLQTSPKFNNLGTAALTTTSTAFQNCYSLKTAPDIDMSRVTTAASMFQNCYMLESVPTYNTSNCTSFSSMFSNCHSLNVLPSLVTTKATTIATFTSAMSIDTIPAYDLSNCTTIGTFINTSGGNNLARVDATGMKSNYSVINQKMGKTALENMFANTVGVATAQTITISGNWGADTALARTGAWSVGGKTMTVSSATSIVPGMYVYGATVSGTVTATFNSSLDRVTMPVGFGLNNGTAVAFTTSSANGLTQYKLYYVINGSGDSFQLALTPGGSPVDITGTSNMSITWSNKVLSVAGTTITFENPLSGSGTLGTTACTFRYLNTYLASIQNWTVTG